MSVKLLVFIFMSLSLQVSAGKIAADEVLDATAKSNLVIDSRVIRQLQVWNPNFKTYRLYDFPALVRDLYDRKSSELPMAVRGDFNGDKIPDYAFLGFDDKNTYVVFVTNYKNKDHVVEVQKMKRRDPKTENVTNGYVSQSGMPLYIGLAAPAEIGASHVLKGHDVLFIETYGGANELVQLDGAGLFKIPDELPK